MNGWNNFSDNNSGKTIGLTGVYTKPKFTLSTNYYVGPENSHTNKGYRNLLDTTLLLTANPKGKCVYQLRLWPESECQRD